MSALVGFDTTFLALMFIPDAKCAVAQGKERVNFLVSDIHGRGDKIVVPTPALSELLVKSGRARNAIIQELSRSSRFVLAPFDVRAALELSLMTAAAFTRKDKRDGATGSWVKVNFDRQIVAVCKVEGVTRIYSEDQHLRSIATREGLTVLGVADIKLPGEGQGSLSLTP